MPKIISDQLLSGLIAYLKTRPYGEVYQAIPALQNLPDAPQGVPFPSNSEQEEK